MKCSELLRLLVKDGWVVLSYSLIMAHMKWEKEWKGRYVRMHV
jgi:hypothetical protein